MTVDQVPPTTTLAWARAGTEFFAGLVAGLADEELAHESLLPGWTRATVVAHVCRNADALGNLLHWARTGVETPMYSGPDQRERDVARSAQQTPAELRADLATTTERLWRAMDAMPASAWSATVRTITGREVRAALVPWLRAREVWLHGVDLRAAAGMDVLPTDMAHALLTDVTTALNARNAPAVELVDAAAGGVWRLGVVRGGPASGGPASGGPASGDAAEPGARVVASVAELLTWLTGRGHAPSSAPHPVPTIPRWL